MRERDEAMSKLKAGHWPWYLLGIRDHSHGHHHGRSDSRQTRRRRQLSQKKLIFHDQVLVDKSLAQGLARRPSGVREGDRKAKQKQRLLESRIGFEIRRVVCVRFQVQAQSHD